MSGEPVVTIVGNLTADPEIRFAASGAAVASFTVASTPRSLDKQSGSGWTASRCSSGAAHGGSSGRTSPSR